MPKLWKTNLCYTCKGKGWQGAIFFARDKAYGGAYMSKKKEINKSLGFIDLGKDHTIRKVAEFKIKTKILGSKHLIGVFDRLKHKTLFNVEEIKQEIQNE